MHLVFWQQIRSPHQFALLDALSRHVDVDSVTLVVSQNIPAARQSMGWIAPEYEQVTVYSKPSAAEIELLAGREASRTIHVFSGFEADAIGTVALKTCIHYQARVAVMAEAPNYQGRNLKGWATHLKYRYLAMRYSRSISHLFTIGARTPHFYESVGFRGLRVVLFGYYIDHPIRTPEPRVDGTTRLLFVGRASPAKGGELLLNALTQVDGNWHLTLVTQGPERSVWEGQAQRLGLSARIQFADFETNEQVQQRMANSDVLILPNTGKEGWGAVVNEALLQGTPVICTTLTGAQNLVLEAPAGGEVVAPQLEELGLALRRFVTRGPRNSEMRSVTSMWAQKNISGVAAADVLVKSLLT